MTLIFDYDGTLHDTAKIYCNAVRTVYSQLVKNGCAQELDLSRDLSDERLTGFLGMTPTEMWESFMPSLPTNIMQQASQNVGDCMLNEISSGNAKLYDGVEAALDRFRECDINCVILSNCPAEYLETHRKYFTLDKWFDGYFAAETYGYIPKENIIPRIIEAHPDSKYIVIGDRLSDIKAAVCNRLPSVGCSYGYGSGGELVGSSIIINSTNELTEAVFKLM